MGTKRQGNLFRPLKRQKIREEGRAETVRVNGKLLKTVLPNSGDLFCKKWLC